MRCITTAPASKAGLSSGCSTPPYVVVVATGQWFAPRPVAAFFYSLTILTVASFLPLSTGGSFDLSILLHPHQGEMKHTPRTFRPEIYV